MVARWQMPVRRIGCERYLVGIYSTSEIATFKKTTSKETTCEEATFKEATPNQLLHRCRFGDHQSIMNYAL